MLFIDLIKDCGLQLPHRKVEQWKYANLKFLEKWQIDTEAPGKFPAEILNDGFLESGHHLLCVNGRFDLENSMPPENDGVTVSLKCDGEVVDDSNPFIQLNQAKNSGQLSIRVKRGVKLTRPIHIMYWSEPLSCGRSQLEIVLEPDSSAEIIESYMGQGEYLQIPCTTISLGVGANLKFARQQAEADAAAHIGSISFNLAEKSNCDSVFVSHGSKFHRLDCSMVLDGEHSEAKMNGVYLADGDQFVDHHTTIQHAKPNTESYQLFKGVLGGKSHAVFNGRVHIVPDAQKSNSSQLNKNLMLTNDAEIDTKPELAIEADDVKAAHGATVGQIDGEETFYLMSRGICRKDATLMLGRAFAIEVLQDFSSKVIRNHLLMQLEQPLSRFFLAEKGALNV